MDTLANNEEPDEMLWNIALHQGMHCLLLRINTILRDLTLYSIGYFLDHDTIFLRQHRKIQEKFK